MVDFTIEEQDKKICRVDKFFKTIILTNNGVKRLAQDAELLSIAQRDCSPGYEITAKVLINFIVKKLEER
jgi:hypothetical protein